MARLIFESALEVISLTTFVAMVAVWTLGLATLA
jgi:hypothetical protein